MAYGISYQGSKNQIANRVVEVIKSSDVFVDVFAGGCAITHCMMVHKKAKEYILNDTNIEMPQMFVDAINGKYNNFIRWISREDFNNSKDSLIRRLFSFNNNGTAYMYGKEIEPYKKAQHWAVAYRDYTLLDEYDPHLKDIIDAPTIEQRRVNCRKISGMLCKTIPNAKKIGDLPYKYSPKCRDKELVAPTNEIRKFLKLPPLKKGENKSKELQNLNFLKRVTNLDNVKRLQSLQSLSNFERIDRLSSLNTLQNTISTNRIKVFGLDYEELYRKITSDPCYKNKKIVFYCDPPYANTSGYTQEAHDKELSNTTFNHNRFYSFVERVANDGYLIYCSERYMPSERFVCIKEMKKRNLFTQQQNTKTAYFTEKVYVPKLQIWAWGKEASLY